MRVLIPAPLAFATAFVAAIFSALGQTGSFREQGAIYLEDSMKNLPRLRVLEATAIFVDSRGSRHVGVFAKGETVELQAVGESLYRVKGRATHGQVVGWVQPTFLTPLKPEFIESLRKNEERRAQVAKLIAQNEVAIGMTTDEVLQSLGKPQRRSTRADVTHRRDIWEYVKFERQPQQVLRTDQFGRQYWDTVWVKVEVGSLSVVFADHVVTEIGEDEDRSLARRTPRIIVQPLELTW